MSEGVVGLGRVQVRRPISASSAIAASSSVARRAPLQTWPQAKVGTWTRRHTLCGASLASLPGNLRVQDAASATACQAAIYPSSSTRS